VPAGGLVGLLVPVVSCAWSSFVPLRPHVCVELAGAFVPLAGVVAALIRLSPSDRRRMGWDLGLAAVALGMAMGPGLGNFRWSFRWLPLFFVALSLAAGEGLAAMRRAGGGTAFVGLCALGLAGFGLLAGLVAEEGAITFPLYYGAGLTAACAVWACAVARAGRAIGPWIPVVLVPGTLAPMYAEPDLFLEFPTWSYSAEPDDAPRVSPETTYLGVYGNGNMYEQPTGMQNCYGGNSPLYRGLTFVNGYSPLRFAGLSQLFGFGVSGAVSEEAATRVLHFEAGPDGLLQLLGVDGLVVIRDPSTPDEDELLRRQGWHMDGEWHRGRLWHRLARPSPRVRVLESVEWTSDPEIVLRRLTEVRHGPVPLLVEAAAPVSAPELGRSDVRIVREGRNGIEIAVDHADPGRSVAVAVSRPWYPGYVARLNGARVPVYRLDLAIPVVILPPGANGTLVLEYRPAALRYGLLVSAGTLVVVIVALLVTVWRTRRRLYPVGAGVPRRVGS
jgi:hypothetical protein